MADGQATTMAMATAYLRIYNNQVISTSNHGISVSAGNNIEVKNNSIISTGLLPDGKRIASANVGSYVQDYYSTLKTGFIGIFTQNTVTTNTIGWINSKGLSNPTWFPSCEPNKCTGNIIVTPTQAMELAELSKWQAKIVTNKVTIGSSLPN